MFKKRRALAQYFILFFSMFAVLMTGIVVLLYCYVMPRYLKEIEKNLQSRNEYAVLRFHDIFEHLDGITYEMYTDENLNSRLVSDSEISLMDGIDNLKKYKKGYDLIENIVLCYDNSDVYCTSLGIVQKKNHPDIQKLESRLNNSAEEKWVCAKSIVNDEEMLLLGKRVKSILPYYKDITLVFEISYYKLSVLVKNECIDESSSFVADFGNGLVFETGDLECDTAAILKRAEGKEGTVYVRPHDVICRQTVYEDVKYTYIMSEKDFLGGYLSFQFNILLGMILLAVTGIVICIKFSRVSYNPITEIYSAIGKDSETNDGVNEFSYIQEFISEIVNKNEELNVTIKFQKMHLRRQALLKILNGDIEDEEQARNLAANTELSFNGRYYVVIVSLDGDMKEKDAADVINGCLSKRNMGYALEILNDGYIAIIVTADESREEFASELTELIQNEFETDAEIFAGNVCTELIQISKSYKHALELYKQRTLKLNEKADSIDLTEERKLYYDVLKFIQDNYTDDSLSLSLISEKTGKSIYYISRLIKSNMGCTFIDYISNLRIAYAKKLLIETDMMIADIVAKVGYLNVPSFNKKFKRIVGKSPTEYKTEFKV